MDHFPVYLSLTLSQRAELAVEGIQDALARYSKDLVRFRTAKNIYCNSIEFRCYFRDPAEVENFAHAALNGFNLVRSPCLGSEEKKCPSSLGQEAQLAVQYSAQTAGHSAKAR